MNPQANSMKSYVWRRIVQSMWLVLPLGAAVGLVPRATLAEEAARDLEWAHVQFNQGFDENNRGNFREAAKILTVVWQKYRFYDVASELGRAEASLGHVAAGAKYAAFAMAYAPPREGKVFRSIHASRMAFLMPKIYFAQLTVTPADLTVAVDGVELDVPIEVGLYLEPGPHRVEFKKTGYVTETRSLDAHANVQDTLVVTLAKQPSTADTPAPPATRPKQAAQPKAPSRFDERPLSPSNTTLSWSILGLGGGLTAIAVSIGVSFHVQGSNAQGNADKLRRSLGGPSACYGSSSRDCSRLAGLVSDRDRDYTRAKISYGVGAGLAVITAAATWYFWPRHSSESGTPSVSAWATPDSAGVVTFGEF